MKKRKCYLPEESRQKGLAKCRELAKAAKEERKEEYGKEPKLCSRCEKPLSYKQRNNKYCSRSCAVKVNNIGVTRHGINRDKPCERCSKITKNLKYCSNECFHKHEWEEIKKSIEKNGCITVGNSNGSGKRNYAGLRKKPKGKYSWQVARSRWYPNHRISQRRHSNR